MVKTKNSDSGTKRKSKTKNDSYLTHDEMRQLLIDDPGREFVCQSTFWLYKWKSKENSSKKKDAFNYHNDFVSRYRVFREVALRYFKGEKTWSGDPKSKHYSFDAVILVQPSECYSLAHNETYTIGIELKGSKSDLRGDGKIPYYIGWTDFFFLGVPDDLADEAITKADEVMSTSPEAEGKIGVFGVESGQIYKWPTKAINPAPESKNAIYEQIIYHYLLPSEEREASTIADSADNVIAIDIPKDLAIRPLPPFNDADKPVAIPVDDADADIDNDNTNSSTDSLSDSPDDAKTNNYTLSDEERRERAEKRAENRQKVEERKQELRDRAEVLLPETREKLAALSDRDNVIFWAIRDSGTEGIDATDLPARIGQSSASITRSIAALRHQGLVELNGGRKFGKFRAAGNAALNSRCMTCEFVDECHGNALLCKTYVARNNS